jgi:hypothetical protein
MIAAQTLPVERRLMPLETKPSTSMLSYLQGIPHIRARLVDEGKEALETKPGSLALKGEVVHCTAGTPVPR